MTDLLREAIADAKAVREVALANAKLALEEAFTPRLQSMLASKLSEEAEEDETMEEGEGEEAPEEETTDESYFFEGEDEQEPVEEEYGDDWFEAEGGSMEEGDEPTEEPVEEGEDEEAPAMEEGEDEEESMDEDLMEIIRQLEEDIDSSEIGTGDNKKPSSAASDSSTEMKKEKLVQLVKEEEGEEEAPVEEGDDSEGDEVDIQEILRALREEDEESSEEPMGEGEDGEEAEAEVTEGKLREAYAVIQFLRGKLNEVNLLNSKLLFSNKLFRSHSLTESQKIKVIENFDRATNLREVKLVYATIAESLKNSTGKVKSISESYRRTASKPVASTRPSKEILSESTQMADRLRKLAGIK